MLSRFLPSLSEVKTVLVRKPHSEIRRFWRWGPRAYLRLNAWKRQMETAAMYLPPIASKITQKSDKSINLWFMSGSQHWYQTAFCAWSFALHSDSSVSITVIDDGSLSATYCSCLRRIFPGLTILDAGSCATQRRLLLPSDRYPYINRVVEKQLLFRKLTDVFCGSAEKRLFLDSDMIFYRRPELIEQFMLSTEAALVQADCWESYGYSRLMCESLISPSILPQAINIGVLGLHGSIIDWEKVEYWLSQLIDVEGWKYNITQCTAAMILAETTLTTLPKSEYEVLPIYPKAARPQRVMEHYVADSKPYYFHKAWRGLLGV